MAAAHAEVTVRSDARQRAMNTLWQGFGVDAAATIGLGLTELVGSADVSTTFFWSALGILILKSLLTSLATYLVRLKRPAVSDPVPATPDVVQPQVTFASAPSIPVDGDGVDFPSAQQGHTQRNTTHTVS